PFSLPGPAPTDPSTLSLHDALPISFPGHIMVGLDARDGKVAVDGWSKVTGHDVIDLAKKFQDYGVEAVIHTDIGRDGMMTGVNIDRKSTRLNSSHDQISYAVFCLKK